MSGIKNRLPIFVATIQAPMNVPRMVNSTQIRASSGQAIIQQHHPANVQIQSHPPALHPVSQNTFTPGGAQVSNNRSNYVELTFRAVCHRI